MYRSPRGDERDRADCVACRPSGDDRVGVEILDE